MRRLFAFADGIEARGTRQGWRACALFLALLVAGCASLGVEARLERFDAAADAYEHAMRWSDLASAYAVAYEPGTEAPPDFQRLKGIQVTSYEAGGMVADPEGKTVTQIVEIRYVHTDRMVELVLHDKQLWEFSESGRRWYLRSHFPDFR